MLFIINYIYLFIYYGIVEQRQLVIPLTSIKSNERPSEPFHTNINNVYQTN